MPDEKLSYEIWEDLGTCPHCGDDMIEITFDEIEGQIEEWFECLECDHVSAWQILTADERAAMEALDDLTWEIFHETERGLDVR
jgi:hypothetical protein